MARLEGKEAWIIATSSKVTGRGDGYTLRPGGKGKDTAAKCEVEKSI